MPPAFNSTIRGLFREEDREAMAYLFDLWEYGDVVANAAAILEQLESGEMPCDGPWTAEAIDLFRQWRDGGYAR